MSRVQVTQLVNQLSAHPSLEPLASAVLNTALTAWRNGDVVFPRPGSPTLAGVELPPEGALAIPGIDLSESMRRGAKSSDELDALTVIALLGAAAAWPTGAPKLGDLTRCLVWLETYTGLRCLSTCGAVFDGAAQRQLGVAIVDLLIGGASSVGQGDLPELSPAELAIARSWLLSLEGPDCADLAQRALQVDSNRGDLGRPIVGDFGPRPLHAVTTALLAVTGLLFVLRAGRALGRWILHQRTPTNLWISERGLELCARHELLGRVVKERRVLVPIEEIRSVEREVRFPKFGLYAGLLALALGTLLGARLFVDGLRVAGLSFPLIGMGLSCVVAGFLLDLLFCGLADSVRGRCRLLVIPRHGRGWSIGELDASGVDRLLTELSTRLAARGV